MPDKYRTFEELRRKEPPDAYRVSYEHRKSKVLVLAIHGGKIEPGTSEVARAIAGEDLSFYCFEGIKDTGNGTLHITSTNFNEPTALGLIRDHEIAISVHGYREDGDITLIGGADGAVSKLIGRALAENGFYTRFGSDALGGSSRENICNKSRRGKGVQLEISRSLRDRLRSNPGPMAQYVGAIRSAIGSK